MHVVTPSSIFQTLQKRAVTASKPPVEKTSERAQAAREKREAARNKFKELKAAAKRARETENTEVEMEVPSPKRTKEGNKWSSYHFLPSLPGGPSLGIGSRGQASWSTHLYTFIHTWLLMIRGLLFTLYPVALYCQIHTKTTLICDPIPFLPYSDTKPPTPKSSRRRSVRKTPSEFRRTSIALINFDDDSDPLRDNAAPPSDHAHNPSDFSPPVGASGSQSDDADVPTGQLLSLSPGKGMCQASLLSFSLLFLHVYMLQ